MKKFSNLFKIFLIFCFIIFVGCQKSGGGSGASGGSGGGSAASVDAKSQATMHSFSLNPVGLSDKSHQIPAQISGQNISLTAPLGTDLKIVNMIATF
jgi:hypothetical protein